MAADESQFIYLDNAATSWPKPPAVLRAIEHFYVEYGGSLGRGGSGRGMRLAQQVELCRKRIKQFLNANARDQIVLGFNGTDVLNSAIQGVLEPGDHVIASVAEHNSILRPLDMMKSRFGIEYDLAQADENGIVSVDSIRKLVRPATRLVCLSHASNVTGLCQPVESVGELCRKKDILFLVDAAQSLGHLPVDVQDIQCDLLAASGHKGLLGPLGTAILLVNEAILNDVKATRPGGTGSQSESLTHPTDYPERLESGNANSPGIFGLLAGLETVEHAWQENGFDPLKQQQALFGDLKQGLDQCPGITIYGSGEKRLATVAFNVGDLEPQAVASILDTSFGIQVRAGYHCAPMMHQSLGTFERGGTLRVSPGFFNSKEDINALIEAVKEIATSSQLSF